MTFDTIWKLSPRHVATLRQWAAAGLIGPLARSRSLYTQRIANWFGKNKPPTYKAMFRDTPEEQLADWLKGEKKTAARKWIAALGEEPE